MGMLNKTAIAVAVATTDAVADINVRDNQDLCIEIKNTGANALDAFVVQGIASDSTGGGAAGGNAVPLLSATGDYTTPKYPLQRATVDPTSLGAGSSTMLFLKCAGLTTVRLLASSAVGTTTLEIHAHAT